LRSGFQSTVYFFQRLSGFCFPTLSTSFESTDLKNSNFSITNTELHQAPVNKSSLKSSKMCKAIIGHCQCVRCMDHPTPGVLRRVDFCDTKQQGLAGLWTDTELEKARDALLPCNNLTFDRQGDPDACHFKVKKNEGVHEDAVQKEDEHNKQPVMDLAEEKPTEVADYPRIKFTPINAVAIARAALASLDEAESSQAHDADLDDDDVDSPMEDVETPPTDDDDEEAVKEAVEQASGAAIGEALAELVPIGKLPVDKPSPADTPKTKKADKASSDIGTVTRSNTDINTAAANRTPFPETPTKKNKGKQPATRSTSASNSVSPSNNTNISSGGVSGSSGNNPLGRPILTPKKPTPSKTTKTTTTGTQTPSKRTPLPTSRPSTPRVRQAEAAAAAAELAARVSRGAWTHEETVRLLLLRCKEVDYDDMHEVSRRYLPHTPASPIPFPLFSRNACPGGWAGWRCGGRR
jgi:hypothetical protein